MKNRVDVPDGYILLKPSLGLRGHDVVIWIQYNRSTSPADEKIWENNGIFFNLRCDGSWDMDRFDKRLNVGFIDHESLVSPVHCLIIGFMEGQLEVGEDSGQNRGNRKHRDTKFSR